MMAVSPARPPIVPPAIAPAFGPFSFGILVGWLVVVGDSTGIGRVADRSFATKLVPR